MRILNGTTFTFSRHMEDGMPTDDVEISWGPHEYDSITVVDIDDDTAQFICMCLSLGCTVSRITSDLILRGAK